MRITDFRTFLVHPAVDPASIPDILLSASPYQVFPQRSFGDAKP